MLIEKFEKLQNNLRKYVSSLSDVVPEWVLSFLLDQRDLFVKLPQNFVDLVLCDFYVTQ